MYVMIVDFDRREAPRASSVADAVHLFDAMTTGILPVLVMDSADGDTDAEVAPLAPVLERRGMTLKRVNSLFRNLGVSLDTIDEYVLDAQGPSLGKSADLMLHFDGQPKDDVIDINMLHTSEGEAEGFFFRPAQALIDRNFRRESWATYLYMTRLFLEGKVDDRLLEPIAYHATLRNNTIVAFQRGGRFPLGHIVQTTSVPRLTNLRGFSNE